MNLQTITPPSGEPLSLADAKAFARIGSDHDDGLVGQLLAAARARVEAETGMALMRRTLRLKLSDWPAGVVDRGGLCLPRHPAAGLVAVRLTDGDTSEDVTHRFEIEVGLSPVLRPVPFGAWVWPMSIHQWIEIDWEAGFGDAEDVPEDLVQALKIIVAHGFEHRDASDWRAQDQLNDRLETVYQAWRKVSL